MGRRSGPRIARIPGRLALLGIAGTLGLCCTPSAASADTATIGSALTRPSNISAFNEAAVTVQRSQEGVTGSNPLTSPANGLVTEWAVMSRDTNAIYSLRVLRPVGPTSYLVAGSAV